jgi:NTP pyrophosphatase (non-canonical NTP hydrolase)
MNFNEYQQLAGVTESRLTGTYLADRTLRQLHGVLGVSSESGELSDALKRHVFYGKPLDETNIKEEVGDVLWYLALLASSIGTTLEECAELNIAKLKARYGEKFSSHSALNRDLTAERAVLEQSASVPVA